MPSMPFLQRASWIWSAEGSHALASKGVASPSHYQVRRFRREFSVAESEKAGATLTVHVTGDSRYLFYCNGTLVSRGPARGDINHHFYDTLDLSRHLLAGQNVLSALVLDMSKVAHRPSALGAPCAIMTYAGGFLLEGDLIAQDDVRMRLDTGVEGWRVATDTAHRFQNDGTRFEGYHGYFEHRLGPELPDGWTKPGFNASGWSDASVLYTAELLENRRDPTSPYGLMPRMIPPMEEGERRSYADCFLPGGGDAGEKWRSVLGGGRPLEIPARQTVRIVLDVGELTTAFPDLETGGGEGAKVRLTYSEALRLPWSTPDAKLLGRPQPLANLASHFADESSGWTFDRRGEVTGWSDVWEPAGHDRERFEPWHWRAFRYVGIEITTAQTPLTIHSLGHRFTAYPYEITAEFACSDEKLERVWRAALRTMRLCSHETFVDCPHYEQMQYAGDTMVTSRLGMLASGDYRLTRQALFQFDWSRLSDGLTQSRFPSRLLQVIPSWSLHWITCIRDYAYCSGDLQTVKALLPGATAVLDWFRRHADADGLPGKLPYWNITDWCPWWPRGVVPGADTGPTCIISSQYISALGEVADLLRLTSDASRSSALAGEADRLRGALNRIFWSAEEGLFLDRPGGPEVSQYGNAYAVVCGASSDEQRRILLRRFPADPKLAPGSFFCWHAVFRALDLCGAGERFVDFLGPWHEQVDLGLDTFVEENSFWRSLCHAWSAHPALEFLTRILGVIPLSPGFARIEIKPQRCGLDHARGRVCTPLGPVDVEWHVKNGLFSLVATAPAGAAVVVVLPDGTKHEFSGGHIELSARAE